MRMWWHDVMAVAESKYLFIDMMHKYNRVFLVLVAISVWCIVVLLSLVILICAVHVLIYVYIHGGI